MAGPQINTVFTARDQMQRTLRGIEGGVSRLDRSFGSLRGRIRSAFEFHIVGRGIAMFERGIHRLVSALPDLINRGEQWARTVDRVVDITGMAAESASELAAVAQNVGVNADGLGRMMNALSKAVHVNADEFADYGIRIKDGNGHMLDAYSIFQNVRQRIAAMGPSLQSARLAQMAFGRAALESADMLTLTNDEWERQADLARRSGLIMSRAGLAAAEEWERTQSRLSQAVTGIGAQILQGVAPALIGLTNGVTKAITDNLDAIVNGLSWVVVTIASTVAGLLGIQLDLSSAVSTTTSKADRDSRRLRQSIDDMNTANGRAARANRDAGEATARHRKEQQRLREEVARANRELARLRSASSPVNASGVEAELWRQQRQARIKDAQDRVQDARRSLAQHRRTMGQMGATTTEAMRRIRIPMQRTFGGGGQKGVIVEGLEQTIKDAQAAGLGIADAIKDAIFGEDTKRTIVTGGLAFEVTTRGGGLLDKMGEVARFLGTVGGHLNNLNGLLGGNGPLVLGLLALAKVLPFGGIPGIVGTAAGAAGGTALGAGAIGVGMVAGPLAFWLAGMLSDGGTDRRLAEQRRRGVPMTSDWPAPPPRWPGAGYSHMGRRGRSALVGGSDTGGMVPWDPPAPGPSPQPGPAPGPAPGLGLSPWQFAFDRGLRRYLGASSPIDQGQQEQLGTLASIFGASQTTADQTAPLGSGTLGVTNTNFPDIGKVRDWSAGTIGVEGRGGNVNVDNKPGTHINVGGTGVNSSTETAIKGTKSNTGTTSSRTGTVGARLLAGGRSAAQILAGIEGSGSGGGSRSNILATAEPMAAATPKATAAARRTASNTDEIADILRDMRRMMRAGARPGPSTSSTRAAA